MVRDKGKVPLDMTRGVITLLCRSRYLTVRVLSLLLDRNETYLRQSVLNPMVLDNELRRAFPQSPNHPRQAYIAAIPDEVRPT